MLLWKAETAGDLVAKEAFRTDLAYPQRVMKVMKAAGVRVPLAATLGPRRWTRLALASSLAMRLPTPA